MASLCQRSDPVHGLDRFVLTFKRAHFQAACGGDSAAGSGAEAAASSGWRAPELMDGGGLYKLGAMCLPKQLGADTGVHSAECYRSADVKIFRRLHANTMALRSFEPIGSFFGKKTTQTSSKLCRLFPYQCVAHVAQ